MHSPSRAARSPRRAPAVAAGLAVATLALAGCVGPGAGSPEPSGGPWASELAYYDEATDSVFAHQALADGKISDAEVEEGRALVDRCYVDHGAEVTYDAYGRATVTVVTGAEDPMQVMGTCEFADGGVVVLHGQVRLNPENQDPFTIQAECLVAHQLVEPGFTAQDLEDYVTVGTAAAPWTPSDQAAACLIDPLGVVDGAGADGWPTP
jgi:hypothetical protein